MALRGSQTLLSNALGIFCYPRLYHFVCMGIGSHMAPGGPVQNTHLPSFHQVARELGYSYADSSPSLAKGGSCGGIHTPALWPVMRTGRGVRGGHGGERPRCHVSRSLRSG